MDWDITPSRPYLTEACPHMIQVTPVTGRLPVQQLLPTSLTLGLAGEGRGLFFTSIHVSESRSGKLVDRPLGIVFRLLTSSVLVGTGLAGRGEPGADSGANKSHKLL